MKHRAITLALLILVILCLFVGGCSKKESKDILGEVVINTDKPEEKGNDPLEESVTFQVIFRNENGQTLKTEIVKKGEAATAPTAPAKDGYRFVDWDKDFSCVTSNLLVTPIYEKIPEEETPEQGDQGESESSPFSFVENSTAGTAVITGTTLSAPDELILPELSPSGYPVVEIGSNAFADHSDLVAVSIPKTVTEIGESAFENCTSLRFLEIPDAVEEIRSRAFKGCSGLRTMKVGCGLESVAANAFEDCSNVYSVELSDDLTAIPRNLFSHFSDNLVALTLGESLNEIPDNTFEDCWKLVIIVNRSDLEIVKGSTANGYVGYFLIDEIPSDPEDSVWELFADGDLIYLYNNDTENYDLICDLRTHEAYEEDEDLIVLELPEEGPNGEEEYRIFRHAFYDREDIGMVVIPDAVSYVGQYAFASCENIMEVQMTTETDLGDGCFLDGNEEEFEFCLNGKHIIFSANKPAEDDGRTYWRFVNGNPVCWEIETDE